MRKKVLALALALVMVIAMLPNVAFAAAEETATDETTLTAALTSVEENGTVKLGGDITVSKSVTITKSMTLDLNGHKLSGAVSNLILINNRAGTKEIALKIVDTNASETKGSIEGTANPVIATVAKNTAKATVELDNGITIKGTTGTVMNISGYTTLTVKDAVVDGATSTKAINIDSTSGLNITGGSFKGVISIAGASSAAAPTRSITGGYFSEFSAAVANCVPENYGLVPNSDAGYEKMYKVGQIDQNVKDNAQAKVKLADGSGDFYVYGDLQQLFDLYRGREVQEGTPVTFEVLKNATLTIDDYGTTNAGNFTSTNTLKISVSEHATVTITATGTKVAKFVIEGNGGDTLNVTAAEGYKVTPDGRTKTCDVDPTSDAIIAIATVSDNTQIITKDNINSFLMKMTSDTTKIEFKKDITLNRVIDVPARAELVIDMGGHTITSNIVGGPALKSISGGKVTLKNGTFDASESGYAISLGVTASNSEPGDPVLSDTSSHGEAIIDEGAIIKGTISVFNQGSKLTMEKDSSVEADGFAITGNGAHDGTAITIKNGAKVTSNTTAAIYHPQEGTLTIGDAEPAASPAVAAPVIEGVAGVVVRDGTVTVNDADITATGTGDIKVGDAETTVPAGGIVLDSVTGYGTGDEKVTVKDATVTVEEGQPSVTYTEEGKAPDYSTESKKPTEHVDVKAGTYQSGEGKADPSMVPFISDEVKENSGLASDGEIKAISEVQKEKPFLVDFGYIADKTDLESSASSWRSPNGITYNASDWKDATFYWAFNRALKDKETVTVKFAISEDNSYTDTCIGSTDNTSPRYASSFLNATQNTDSAVVEVGDWTISSPDGTFTVSEEFQTAEVTLPKTVTDSMPVVTPATLSADAETTEGSVKAQITKADNDKKEYTVAVEANNLHEHENGEGNMGYWVGFAVEVPKDQEYKGFYYQFEGEEAWKYSGLEDIATNTKGVAFYFADTKNTDVKLVWTTEEAKGSDPTQGIITFHVDFTGVKHYVPTPVNPPVSGGTATPAATVTTPASTNGSYTVSDKNAKAGDTVTITPKADEGYTVDAVVVTDKDGKDVTVTDNGDGTYSFVMPEKASQPVTVKVTFAKVAPSAKFVDVPQTAWYAEYVDYVVANGLMEGTSDTIFSPNMTTNRAMLVTILYRLEGKPAVTKDIPFSDVAAGEWYSDAINWAAANEIVNGYGDDTFRPLRELSREEAAAILYRYAEYKEYDVTATDDLAGYTDAGTVSTWADTAMSWAVAEGIIKGTSETKLTPDGTAVRAQAAAMLTRFCENVVK